MLSPPVGIEGAHALYGSVFFDDGKAAGDFLRSLDGRVTCVSNQANGSPFFSVTKSGAHGTVTAHTNRKAKAHG